MTGMQRKKDYQALRYKLARGKLLADAAAEAGMTVEEAQTYLTSRETEDDKALRAFADEALSTALMALKRAVREKNRATIHHTIDEESGYKTMHKEAVLDVEAAKALLDAAMDAKKMLRKVDGGRGGGEDGQRDLFDEGPWTFKKSD